MICQEINDLFRRLRIFFERYIRTRRYSKLAELYIHNDMYLYLVLPVTKI